MPRTAGTGGWRGITKPITRRFCLEECPVVSWCSLGQCVLYRQRWNNWRTAQHLLSRSLGEAVFWPQVCLVRPHAHQGDCNTRTSFSCRASSIQILSQNAVQNQMPNNSKSGKERVQGRKTINGWRADDIQRQGVTDTGIRSWREESSSTNDNEKMDGEQYDGKEEERAGREIKREHF